MLLKLKKFFQRRNDWCKNHIGISLVMIVGILAVVCLLEVSVFNYRFWFSRNASDEEIEQYQVGPGLSMEDNDGSLEFSVSDKDKAYIEIFGIDEKIGYLYYDAYNSEDKEVSVDVYAKDEGNSEYYLLGNIHILSEVDSSLYKYIHSYGKVQDLKLQFLCNENDRFVINDIIVDAQVLFHFQWKRVLLLFALGVLLWILRPSSVVYRMPVYIPKENENKDELLLKQKQKSIVFWVVFVQIVLLYFIVNLNNKYVSTTDNVDDGLPWHHCYQRLAVALDEGRVDIDSYSGVDLSNVSNPYDRELRNKEASGSDWDTAYYKGKYYVYFGIVPELVFYYPYYKIVHKDFQTWMGVYICAVLLLIGVFLLLYEMIKRWFKKSSISFVVYLILATVMSHSMGLYVILMRADFYVIPITMALALSVWGLYFWMKSQALWSLELGGKEKHKRTLVYIVSGAICMALVAGCRPQLVIVSFLVIPIFWSNVFPLKQQKLKTVITRFVGLMVPYIAVAAGLMYYNFIRFGSVFEFGAKYNLTTNDVVHRGFYWGRIPSAIMMYLLKLPNVGTVFPYLKETANISGYVGTTIIEPMFGGIFFLQIFLLVLFKYKDVQPAFKEKKMRMFVGTLVVLGLLMTMIDAQMGGLLVRYSLDFSWLFWCPAVLIYLQWYENSLENEIARKKCVNYLLVTSVMCLFVQFMLSVLNGNLLGCETETYYKIQELFLS